MTGSGGKASFHPLDGSVEELCHGLAPVRAVALLKRLDDVAAHPQAHAVPFLRPGQAGPSAPPLRWCFVPHRRPEFIFCLPEKPRDTRPVLRQIRPIPPAPRRQPWAVNGLTARSVTRFSYACGWIPFSTSGEPPGIAAKSGRRGAGWPRTCSTAWVRTCRQGTNGGRPSRNL